MTRLSKSATLAAVATLLGALAFDAAAATIRVQCEVRPGRAKASVDGMSLAAGSYTAQIVSGGNTAVGPAQRTVAGEVEFDFDSNPNDIAAGAVAIPSSFIVGGTLTGKVVDAAGNTVISDTVACRVRTR